MTGSTSGTTSIATRRAAGAGCIARVVSGGQTGVDRAALDAAMALGIPCRGWCPRGRIAEDGVIPARYPLRETASADPAERTRRNVRDSDATLILIRGGRLDRGTELTRRLAVALGRPLLLLDLDAAPAPDVLVRWLARPATTLNVAGPRESSAPGIYACARRWLEAALALARCRSSARGASATSSSGSVAG